MTTDAILESETKKWLKILEERLAKTSVEDKKVDNEIENVKAYIHDSKYFLGKKDLVRAFEAVIYAYGIYETCLRVGLVSEKE